MASSARTHATGIAPTARCPRGIGLVFLDLDGTMTVAGQEVRPRVAAALRAAHAAGVTLAVASGRPLALVPAAVRELGVMDYYVCANGATVHDAALSPLHEAGMSAALASGLVWALEPLGAAWNAFFDGRAVAELRNTTYMVGDRRRVMAYAAGSPRRALRAARRMLLGRGGFRQVRDIRPTLAAATTVEKLGCSFSDAERAAAAAELLAESGLTVAVMGARELEVTAPGVDKGSGAAWLARHLGIPAERAVAFGDSANDVPLARAVGCLVAMGNADGALRAVATCACPPVGEDGVATWLEAQMAEATH